MNQEYIVASLTAELKDLRLRVVQLEAAAAPSQVGTERSARTHSGSTQ